MFKYTNLQNDIEISMSFFAYINKNIFHIWQQLSQMQKIQQKLYELSTTLIVHLVF